MLHVIDNTFNSKQKVSDRYVDLER